MRSKIETFTYHNKEDYIEKLVRFIDSARKDIFILEGEFEAEIWDDPRVVDAIERKVSPQDYFIKHLELGIKLGKKGMYGNATVEFEKVKRVVKPTAKNFLSNLHNDIGYYFLQLGKYPEAVRNLETSIRYNPKHIFAYNNLAEVLKECGEYESAIRLYKKALRIMPNHPTAKESLERVSELIINKN